jgi:hypothetical protein
MDKKNLKQDAMKPVYRKAGRTAGRSVLHDLHTTGRIGADYRSTVRHDNSSSLTRNANYVSKEKKWQMAEELTGIIHEHIDELNMGPDDKHRLVFYADRIAVIANERDEIENPIMKFYLDQMKRVAYGEISDLTAKEAQPGVWDAAKHILDSF